MKLPDIIRTASELYHCDIAFSDLHLDPMEIRISHFQSNCPGHGRGTACIHYVIQCLKAMGIKKILLLATPLGGMSKEQRALRCQWLIDWYMMRGFEVVGYSYDGMLLVNAEMEMRL